MTNKLTNKDWVKEYFELGFSPYPTKEDIEKFNQLKYKNLPDKIYKYKSLDDFTIENIENNNFFLSPIELLNDTWECVFFIDHKKVKFNNEIVSKPTQKLQKVIYLLRTNYEKNSNDKNKTLLEIVEKTYIDSLQKDIKQFLFKDSLVGSFAGSHNNILMWAHYANNHEGICIEYDIENMYDTWGDFLYFLHPVQYKENLFDLTDFVLANIGNKDINELQRIVPALTKNIAWDYEREWRLLAESGNLPIKQKELDNGGVLINMPKPSAIYKGERFDKNSQRAESLQRAKKLDSLCKSKNIPMYEMVSSQSRYEVEALIDTIVTIDLQKNKIHNIEPNAD